MGYKLCIAEKPSVASDIASVIGANKRCNGYFEGNGYRVTWAVGHLVGLAEPEAYGYMSKDEMWDRENPQNKEKALSELPLYPDNFKLIVLPKTKEQFEIVKKLMLDNDCDMVINCGDCGAEGSVLQWLIRTKVGCTKPEKRFFATSMTKEAITDAFNHLLSMERFEPVIRAEMCKKKADWIMGISMSRGASLTYNARVDVGRVQSPTLYFVVKRFLEVENFKSVNYYSFCALMKDGFSVKWDRDTKGIFPVSEKDGENRLLNKSFANAKAKELSELGCGTITAFETKNRAVDRPQLYDITELERDGNRLYGYSAEEVLTVAQSLYEKHKVTTYPRTDSRYITQDIAPYMESYVRAIAKIEKYKDEAEKLLKKGLNIDKKIVDDEKVTDHHAIIVTKNINDFDMSVLSEIEKNILNLIITRILVSMSDKYLYKETVVNVGFENGMIFSAKGKVPVNKGWKSVQDRLSNKPLEDDEQNKDDEEEQIFPPLVVGQKISLEKIDVLDRKTTPPKLHTQATLLSAMENAGATLENGTILKGKGIGTQATRASIISSLYQKGYVVDKSKGKIKYLIPTKQGINVIKVLPKELYSPKITADWEQKIAEIVDGKATEHDFMRDFKQFVNEKLDFILKNKIDNVDFSLDRVSVGACPWCGKPLYEGQIKDRTNKKINTVYCSEKECNFSVRKNDVVFKARAGKDLTTAQVKKMIVNGFVDVPCKSKSGNEYKGRFCIVKNDKGYANIKFEFAPVSKGNKKNPFS